MTAITRQPVTADILRAKFTATDELVWIPASKETFWNLIELPEFHIEYVNNQIVGTMSYGALMHERIIKNLIGLFIFNFNSEEHEPFGSNRPIHAEPCDCIFEADVHMVSGEMKLYNYGKTKTATANPSVIVEVLSDSTRDFDNDTKLPCYKQMPSVQHILLIDQKNPNIQLFSRTKKPNEWLESDYSDLSQRVKILGKYFSLKTIYNKVIFNI